MSITYGIIEKHGGKIEFTSEENKGTEFVITLPKSVREANNDDNKKVAESK